MREKVNPADFAKLPHFSIDFAGGLVGNHEFIKETNNLITALSAWLNNKNT